MRNINNFKEFNENALNTAITSLSIMRESPKNDTSTEVDNKGSDCKDCDGGFYEETSMQDGLDGIVSCNGCNKRIKRYSKK